MEIKEKIAKITNQQAELARNQKALEQTKAARRDEVAQIAILTERIAKNANEHTAKLAEKTVELTRASEEIEDKERDIADLNLRIRELESDLRAGEAKLAEAVALSDQLRVQANDAAGAVEEAEMLARAAGEKKELEGQLAGIRLEKQKLEEELEASKVALGAKSEECQRLEESLAAVEAERQEAAEKIGRLAAELDQQQKSVQGDQDRRDAEIADLQRQILDLQTELAKSEGWEAEKARLAFSAQSIQEELDGERDVNRELQQAFQEQQAELERLKAISDTPLDKIQSECQSLVDDKAKAELRAEELQAAVNALTAQLDAYTFTSSSESLESVTKERDELRSDLEKLRQGKFFDFENAIEENRLSFKMARDVYEERIRKIERARDKMKERMGALVREKDALVREKGALVREKGALDKTKKMLDRAVGIIKTTPNFNIDADDEVKFLLEEFDAMPATASSAAATGTLMAAIQHAAWDELRAAQPKKTACSGDCFRD